MKNYFFEYRADGALNYVSVTAGSLKRARHIIRRHVGAGVPCVFSRCVKWEG